MTEELNRLLAEFGDSWSLPVSSASFNAFGQVKVFYVPALVADAVKDGLLETADDQTPIVASDKVYFRELRLTNKGRESIGLSPWPVDKPNASGSEKKPAKKQFTKNLFD